MRTSVYSVAVSVLLAFLVGCDGGVDAPSPPRATTSVTLPAVSYYDFPPLSGPSQTFVFERELSYPVREFTRGSRFVLYDNGAFELQYPNFSYRGAYRDADGVLGFGFYAEAVVEPDWGTMTGLLRDSSLEIDFRVEAEMADFEDAAYSRVP